MRPAGSWLILQLHLCLWGIVCSHRDGRCRRVGRGIGLGKEEPGVVMMWRVREPTYLVRPFACCLPRQHQAHLAYVGTLPPLLAPLLRLFLLPFRRSPSLPLVRRPSGLGMLRWVLVLSPYCVAELQPLIRDRHNAEANAATQSEELAQPGAHSLVAHIASSHEIMPPAAVVPLYLQWKASTDCTCSGRRRSAT